MSLGYRHGAGSIRAGQTGGCAVCSVFHGRVCNILLLLEELMLQTFGKNDTRFRRV